MSKRDTFGSPPRVPRGTKFDTRPMNPKRGFAAMTPAQRRVAGMLGGRLSHAGGKAHEWDSQEATKQGRRGGAMNVAIHGKEHMKEIGKLGGRPKGYSPKQKQAEQGEEPPEEGGES